MQALPPQVTQAKLPEVPKVIPLQVPQAPQVRPLQERLPEVVNPTAAAKKPEPAPQRTLRDRGMLKPAVRFKDEIDGLGSKKSTKKTCGPIGKIIYTSVRSI